jgi:hypothetical protein
MIGKPAMGISGHLIVPILSSQPFLSFPFAKIAYIFRLKHAASPSSMI